MEFEYIIKELVLIYAGAAILSTIFLFLRQPIIISYICLGMIIGPHGLGLIKQPEHIEQISHIGIILLLFLTGLNLHPNQLYHLLKKTASITIVTSTIFAIVAFVITYSFGFSLTESLIASVAMMFSSTVVGLKLIPTTELHHRYIGELMSSVLLFQDLMAIIVILFVGHSIKINQSIIFIPILLLILKAILLMAFAIIFIVYFVLKLLFRKFDVIQEYIFIIALGWCMAIAGIAKWFGLSYEIGAFIAGTSLAMSPISLVISEHFKSLREFFLILFFFAIGAHFDFSQLKNVVLSGSILAAAMLIVKPIVFKKMFKLLRERAIIADELAFRLGQASEFSLLIAYTALLNNKISNTVSCLIQFTVILTFIISTYIVATKYPTPIAADDAKRRD